MDPTETTDAGTPSSPGSARQGDSDATAEAGGGPFVVGIGASAGGLEAIRALLQHVPREVAASYVIAQHMSPRHKSLLRGLLDRESPMDVEIIVDGVMPREATIYVPAPGFDIVLRNGRLYLVDAAEDGASPRPSVDRFFASLAAEMGQRAIGVVLSGTGSDGTHGVRALHKAGARTIVQDVLTARYDGMPSAVLGTGCADLVLSPAEIGSWIARLPGSLADDDEADADDAPLYAELESLLVRHATSPAPTRVRLRRGAMRRMAELGVTDLAAYISQCREDPGELAMLAAGDPLKAIRIFRGIEEIAKLSAHFRALVARTPDRPVRAWVPGCASGEVAYAAAILLAENLGGPEALGADRLAVFATDTKRDALARAKEGVYPADAVGGMPDDMIAGYTSRDGDKVHMSQALRDIIAFSFHRLATHAPLGEIDLIWCRNVLGYLHPERQRRALERLHRALRPSGLLIADSDVISISPTLFDQVGTQPNVYRRRIQLDVEDTMLGAEIFPSGAFSEAPAEGREADSGMLGALLRGFGCTSMLFDARGRILRVHGPTDRIVTLADGGRPSLDRSILVEPLRTDLPLLTATALKKCCRQMGAVRELADGSGARYQLEAIPLAEGVGQQQVLVLFNAVEAGTDTLPETSEATDPRDAHIASLQQKVDLSAAALDATVGDLQQANDGLLASNHELVALNEELRTSNEELSTSNQQLLNSNAELRAATAEVVRIRAQQTAMFDAVDAAILVVGADLHISSCNAPAHTLFGIAENTASPHLSECAAPPGFPSLTSRAETCLQSGNTLSEIVGSVQGRFRLTCTPTLGASGEPTGAIVTLVVLPEAFVRAEQSERLVADAPILLVHRDGDGLVIRINRRSAELFGTTVEMAEGRLLTEILPDDLASPIIKADQEFLASGRDRVVDTVRFTPPSGKPEVWLQLERQRIAGTYGAPDTLYIAGSDITRQVRLESRLRALNHQMELATRDVGIAFWTVDLVREQIYWSGRVYEIHGVTRETYTPEMESAINFYHPDDRDMVTRVVSEAAGEGKPFAFTARLVRADGEVVRVRSECEVELGADGKAERIVGIFREIE